MCGGGGGLCRIVDLEEDNVELNFDAVFFSGLETMTPR